MEVIMEHAIKMTGENTIAGYGVVWGDPTKKDMTGEYFTQETDFALDWYESRPLLYHHGLDSQVQIQTVGRVTKMAADEIGIWVESQLAK